MNRKKKQLYGLVLGVAAMALLADQVILQSTPESASAVPSTVSTTSSPQADAQSLTISVAAAPFPQIDVLDSPLSTPRDPFAVSESVLAQMSGVGATRSGQQQQEPEATRAETFKQSHRLQGVLVNGDTPVAVVDGVFLNVGDALGYCEVTDIQSMAVTFACHDETVTLSVPVSGSK